MKAVYLIEDPTGEAEKGWLSWAVVEEQDEKTFKLNQSVTAKLTKEDLRVMLAGLS